MPQTREQFRALFEDAPVAYHEVDETGCIRLANRAECELLGYEPVDLIGKPVWDLVAEQGRESARHAVLAKLAGKRPPHSFTREYRSKNGADITVEIHEKVIRSPEGTITGIRSMLLDVTEKKRMAEALRRSERRFRLLVENQGEGVSVTDAEQRVTFANPAAEIILGVEPGALIGRNVREFLPPDQAPILTEQMHHRERGETTTYELQIVRLDGTRRILRVTGAPYPEIDEAGASFGILHDITEERQAQMRLADSEARFRRLASAAQDAIIVMDDKGITTFWNKAAERIFGYSEPEVLGRKLYELICPPDRHDAYLQSFSEFHNTGRGPTIGATAEVTAQRKGGERFLMELSLSTFPHQDRWNFIGMVRDITQRKRSESRLAEYAREIEAAHAVEERNRRQLEHLVLQLDEAKSRAEAANQAKSQFLASMSHEIRTPLNGIIGMSGLLLDGPLSEEQRSCAEALRVSADALLGIVDDVLDFSKIEAGRMRLENIPLDLRGALEDAVESVASKAHEKGLELILRYHPSAPLHVIGDPGRIRQIVLNLLSNAIKFTESGQVLLEAVTQSTGEQEAQFRISVHDTGIGISPDKLHLLFERFSQADTSTTRRYGGTGLGLAICRQLSELMGGRISATSKPGTGSVFSVWLTLGLDRATPRCELPVGEVAGVRVLIVDDNRACRFAVRELCANWGMRVDEADCASAALVKLVAAVRNATPFQLVIADWLMPEMDGEKLTRAIRATPSLRSTPVVLLSSATPHDEPARFARAGCTGHLWKPIRSAALFEMIRRIIGDSSVKLATPMLRQHDVQSRQITISEAQDTHQFQGRRVLLVEDNRVNQKLGVRLLEKFGCSVDVSANGSEAVRMSAELPYDLILMDCRMPEMDGYEATRRIRHLGGQAALTPIIAVTASVTEGERNQCLEAGMNDYVSKPIRLDALVQALDKWLRQPLDLKAAG